MKLLLIALCLAPFTLVEGDTSVTVSPDDLFKMLKCWAILANVPCMNCCTTTFSTQPQNAAICTGACYVIQIGISQISPCTQKVDLDLCTTCCNTFFSKNPLWYPCKATCLVTSKDPVKFSKCASTSTYESCTPCCANSFPAISEIAKRFVCRIICTDKPEARLGDKLDSDANTCIMRRGKKLRTFSNTKERIKFPCKYNAVRDTVCGSWKVTVTPGNAIEADKDKRYIVKTMWVGVERLSDGMKWEGRSDLKIAEKFLEGAKDAPFNKKDGALETTDVFNFGPTTEDDEVSLIEKNNDFKIVFGLYMPDDTWHRRSGFQFHCYSTNFQPRGYPDQICGNGTKDEVATFKKANNMKDSRQAVIFHQVFTNMGVVQTNSDCLTTSRTMSNKCKGMEFEAAQQCWPVVGKKRFLRCVTENLEVPESAMRHCVEYVCSNYTDPNACAALSDELDGCQQLGDVSLKVKSQCAPDLAIKL